MFVLPKEMGGKQKMKEEDRIKLWLALYEEGDIRGGECYIDEINLTRLLKEEFDVHYKEIERETLMLSAWGVIEKVDQYKYRRKKSWKPSLGMLFLDKLQGAEEEKGK